MTNSEYKKKLILRVTQYSKDVIKFVSMFPNERSCRIIGDQLLRSATSVGANIVEAQSSSSKKDFTNFLTHALKSANESIYWFTLLTEIQGTDQREGERLMKETTEIARILGSTISKLKGEKR